MTISALGTMPIGRISSARVPKRFFPADILAETDLRAESRQWLSTLLNRLLHLRRTAAAHVPGMPRQSISRRVFSADECALRLC